MPAPKQRIAILGGGAGALAAAYELSATKGLRDRYDVTVYTLGWRLGGKGASGRNRRRSQRIEEHGLHIWFGFYDNAFQLMKDTYAALGRREGTPLRRWDDAFKPCHEIVLCDEHEGAWSCQTYALPPNPLEPGRDIDARDLGPAEVLVGLVDRLEEHMNPLAGAIDRVMGWLTHNALKHAVRMAATSVGARAAYEVAADVISRFDELVWDHVAEDRLDHSLVRRSATLLDFWGAVIRGIVDDDIIEQGFGVANDEDLREWLRRHGCRPFTLQSPFLRGFYDLVFGYEGGDRDKPSLAAGKALQAMLRIGFTYKGAVLWKMQAGMGDAVFAPLYQVLKRRGVRFEFFQRVTRLGVDAQGRAIEEIDIQPQVRLNTAAYEPLCRVRNLACWPSEPDWRQVTGGEQLRASGINLELADPPDPPAARRLRRGRDFDRVVLAIPVGALPPICEEIAAANPRFERMLRESRTVATQAAQVWLHRRDGATGPGELMGSYVTPLDTCCDMTHLAGREGWAEGEELWIGYLCGAMREPRRAATQAQADARAREDALRYLRDHAAVMWPHAVDPATGGFDWSLLVDPADGDGEARLEAQYWRANVHGAERYVLTPPKRVRRRLAADESGFENLVLAGDWTRNGIDGGSVEAAVTSGMQAAQAITGVPLHIAGVSGWLADS